MRFLFLMMLCLTPLAARAVDNDSPLIIIDAPKAKEVKAEAKPETPTEAAKAAAPAVTPETKAAPKPNAPVAAAAAQAIIDDFPVWAVSKAGADTTGQTGDTPASPETPVAPAAPAPPPAAEAPKAPPAPASPTDKLWPRDTVPIFMRSCTGLHVELMAPCTCVITKLMVAMPHNEFLELTAANKIDDDKRVLEIRGKCLAAPGKRKDD